MSQQTPKYARVNNAPADTAKQQALLRVLPVCKTECEQASWLKLVESSELGTNSIPHELADLFGPLIHLGRDQPLVIGQLGQSLDGRIATHTGHSKYINGDHGLLHLHRLRALVDAVVVGIGTALADDPQLTVRMCAGNHPARVIIDPRGRLPASSRVLQNDGTRSIVITTSGSEGSFAPHVEILEMPSVNGRIEPGAIVKALASLGFNRLLIEGGAHTISSFIEARALDRLHILMAPVILGSGQSGLGLPRIDLVDQALRPITKAHLVGDEVIFDCDFSKC